MVEIVNTITTCLYIVLLNITRSCSYCFGFDVDYTLSEYMSVYLA